MSPLPHKGLIICTSRSWETPPGENTRYVFRPCLPHCSDFFVLHSIAETAAFALRYLLFSHILSGCEKKKKEPQRRLRGREAARAAYTCCATDLQRRGESLEDRGDTAHGSEPLPGRRPHLQKHAGSQTSFNSWQIQNRISLTISELYTFAKQDDFFLFLQRKIFPPPQLGVSPTRRHSLSSVCF